VVPVCVSRLRDVCQNPDDGDTLRPHWDRPLESYEHNFCHWNSVISSERLTKGSEIQPWIFLRTGSIITVEAEKFEPPKENCHRFRGPQR
jgi:hypothetical protein